MERNIFEDIYKFASMPVIVCDDNEDMTVCFVNKEAGLLLNPTLAVEMLSDENLSHVSLWRIMRFNNLSKQNNFRQAINNISSLNRYSATIYSSKNIIISVILSANKIQLKGCKYIVIYIFSKGNDKNTGNSDLLSSMLNMTYHSTDIDQSVQLILSSVGEYINISRVYIFEDLFNNYVRNTYEWCAPGVEPVIQTLQNVCKDDYHHDVIINPSGLYIADDLRDLPEIDRAVLEPQSVKAIAILPLFHQNEPIGYIGYDDCQNTRKWNHKELTLLKGISSIVSSLIIRRNAETEIKRRRETLQTISDNIEPIIYVNDLETYRLKFVNRAMAMMFGAEPEQLVGKLCWEVLQKDMSGPCPFCPISKLHEADTATVIEWEHQNTVNGIWFWVKDSIIQWIDGKPAHFETAIDITLRKQYEKQLQHYASIDTMTGVFNREWGTRILNREHESARDYTIPMSLCFIDIDGLKETNDSSGHEAGDEVILHICDIIRNSVRKEDMICRWGGDEFIVLIKCEMSRADAIMRSIQDDMRCGGQEHDVLLSFSYGLVDFTASDSVEAAVAMADSLMYENKKVKRAKQ